MSKKVKAIGFIRADNVKQTYQNQNIETQENQILEAAIRSNVRVVEWFKQEGHESIRYPNQALDKAVEYCKANQDIKYLIVAAPSHLARSLERFQYWKIAFERVGVTITSIDLNADKPLYAFSESVVVLPSNHDLASTKEGLSLQEAKEE